MKRSAQIAVTYDPKYGLGYIYLAGKRVRSARSVRVSNFDRKFGEVDDVILDFDRYGRLIGIETLQKRHLHPSLKRVAAKPVRK